MTTPVTCNMYGMIRLPTHARWLLVPSLPKVEERGWTHAMLLFVAGAALPVGAVVEYIEDSEDLNPSALFRTSFYVPLMWSLAALHAPPVYGHRGVASVMQAAIVATLLACVATFFLDLNTNPGGSWYLSLETEPFLWALGPALLMLLAVGNTSRTAAGNAGPPKRRAPPLRCSRATQVGGAPFYDVL